MARTSATIQPLVPGGLKLTMTAFPTTGANNGIKFANDGNTCVLFVNAGAGAATLTEDATGTIAGIGLTDPTFSVSNDSVPHVVGPFDRQAYGGTVGIDSSLATGLTFAVFQISRT